MRIWERIIVELAKLFERLKLGYKKSRMLELIQAF